MAKRNKAKFAAKSRKSALRVEALEQRQLLAAVTGGGTEVGSNIVHPNGNVYDQVLMTGASVTVTADPGQVTRVSFLDLQGDIVQAEFSGPGSLTISLDQFKAAAEATTYNQPGVKYVQGLATFTIQGETSQTNFSAFSVGSGNAINQSLFAGGKTGGNHLADVARLLIVADPAAPGGSTMGGIRMGNVVFSDTAGVVGIAANNVQTQGPVIIGDVDATNAGVPTLKFGTNSQFATLTVAGGDLLQTNSQVVQGGGFASINSQAGADSTVESRPGFTAGAANIGSKVIATGTVDLDPNTAGVQNPQVVTLEVVTSFDLTGKTQADIDAAFRGRTFQNDITISGDLSGVNSLSVAEFRGAVTFTGTLAGNVTVDGGIKSLTLAKTNSDTIKAASIGAITTTGTANLGGTVIAKSIGAVTVGGDLTGTLSTDYFKTGDTVPGTTVAGVTGAWDLGETTIGAVTVTGNASGTLYGVLGVGAVTVGKDVTSGTDFIKTTSGSSGDSFLGNVGKVTVTGDVRQASGDNFINIAGNGTFGDVVVLGAGTNTSSHTVGQIKVTGVLGAAGTTAGSITVTDDLSNTGSTLTLGQITIGSASNNGSVGAISVTNTAGNVAATGITFTGNGSVGNVSVVGGGVSTATGSLGTISLSTGTAGATLGNVAVSGVKNITLAAITAKNIGTIDATATTAGTNAGTITTAAVTANNGTTNATIGNITLNAGTLSGAAITIGGSVTTNNTASNGSSSIGNITLTAGTNLTNNISFNTGAGFRSATIGTVTHNGSTTFSNGGPNYQALKSIGALTFNGNTQFNTMGDIGATATSTLTGGAVTGFTVTNAGTGYTAAPTVTLSAAPSGGTNATATATFAGGVITGFTITNAGSGYTAAPTVTIASGTSGGQVSPVATPNIRFGGTAGPAITFNGTTTFNGIAAPGGNPAAGAAEGVAPAILASNGGSALDNIGSLTFNGKVVGVAGKVDIRASSIGAINVVAALAQGESLVKDLNVYAGNNGVLNAASNTSTETVARDGSNLSSYSIGNITVSNTNTIGVTNTALFDGSNSFQAIGAVGNVSFSGGGSAAVQTKLFEGTGSDGAFVQVGNGNAVSTTNATLNGVVLTGSGIDFDGNAIVGNVTAVTSGVYTDTDESSSIFSTSGTVSIGNVSINAAQNATDSVLNLGDGTAGGTDGLVVLSGAKLTGTADYSVAGNLAGIDPTRIRGTVGDVLVQNLNQQLSRFPAGTATDTQAGLTNPSNGGLVVGVIGTGTTSPVGKVQGIAFNGNGTLAQDNYVVGGSDATLSNDELQVIIL